MKDDAPLREPTYLILTSLAAGPRHGYAVIEDVRDISAGRVVIGVGTLYTAIDRLRADGLIEVDREEIVDSRLRRYYRLTADGTRRLAAETERLTRHATAAAARLKVALARGEPA
ncbi:PadR family transcriptional regulator [Asanoa sp. WMMD1127]|uniref:PadR family transcriptional regulator n=1 Tax=Asanoa sp. WMMD1127 TaxID=3016107 RepID=UPI002417ECD8|nr:PadR family transcriptional regulator [Asanoa sp. WMMD1127]MDG4821094.1 PadR family transcriptional regulator [Asanoa sp. WMMD1127]